MSHFPLKSIGTSTQYGSRSHSLLFPQSLIEWSGPAWERETDPICVLFVEDDADYRESVGDELAEHGFRVLSFPDGASLIASIGVAAEADLLILDWRLPDIAGIDLLHSCVNAA